jgi:ubiquinone/menaquinone biosynthesis C-methylase UbiE
MSASTKLLGTKIPSVDAARVFSEIAPLWEAHERGHPGRADTTARRAVAVLRSGGSVLDIGCGTGAVLARIGREARRSGRRVGSLVGVDVARDMVARAGRRPGVSAARARATRLPFADQTFDVVLARHVLHFVDDPERAAREMFRVALPGATIVAELAVGASDPVLRRLTDDLPRRSLLRRYLEVPRSYRVAGFVRMLSELGCDVRLIHPPGDPDRERFLRRVARRDDLRLDPDLSGRVDELGPGLVVVARLPGPRTGSMSVQVSGLPGWSADRVRALLHDLPGARGYQLVVKPLRYRKRPHVQALCEFARRRITVQVPVPFKPFSEEVPYRAQRVGAKGFRFRWYSKRLRFERPEELIRYLYLHEYHHWYQWEVLGRRSVAAETACDRFALQRL